MKVLVTSILCCVFLFGHAADYYWVGGSGNWSDISHWAPVSGGTVTYPVAPTSEDNVIFDENSFTGPNQVLTFFNEISFCKSMDWSNVTNNPTVAGDANVTISIFGDLTLHPDILLTFEGKFLFTGVAEDKRIDLADLEIPGVMTFEGESTWDMDSGIRVDSMLEVSSGNLNLNGLPIICRYLHINTVAQKNIDIENSNILISGAYQDEFGYDGNGSISFYMQNAGLTLSATGSIINLSAPNPTFFHVGGNDEIRLHSVIFSAPSGSVFMTSNWHEESLYFNDLTFNTNAEITGTIAAESINFAAGGRYQFGAQRNYVFGTISATGDCAEGVSIISNNPGFPATFTVNAGTVDLEYVTLRDIHGVGGATLNANNGVDLGNNDGWVFTNSAALDFFWIGGTGLWDDPTHWSFTSGGPSSGCVPSGKDNAFFDANSFSAPNQSVGLNSSATFIHDMIWNGVTGSPEFTGDEMQRFVITGSLELDADMEHDIAGVYDFESNEVGNTIRMNGNIFNESITFSGIPAEWLFLDDVEVFRTVYFNSGTLRTGGNQFIMNELGSYTGQERLLDISDSYLLLRLSMYDNPSWVVNLQNYTVIADNSTIEFTANANFEHNGNWNGPIPNYNLVRQNGQYAVIRSVNEATDESEPAIVVNNLSFAGRGVFNGSSHIRSLRLAEGFSYYFDSDFNRRQIIDDIVVQGSCENGLTQLSGGEHGSHANIEFPTTFTLERMLVQDINIIAGGLINNNSIDGGNNVNVTFNELLSRTLYWVGDEGEWQDPIHWSLSSGGPGGECIPTLIDDVIFDENSFTLAAQVVTSIPSTFAYCHDINVIGTTGNPQMNMDILLINGSLAYDNDFLNNINEHIFIGRDLASIDVGGHILNNVRFRGSGQFDFASDFLFNNWYHDAGTVNFNDYLVHGSGMYFYGGSSMTLNLHNSTIILEDGGDSFNDRSDFLVVNPGNSELILTADFTGIFSNNQLTFNKVVFPNTSGTGYLASRVSWDPSNNVGEMSIANIQFNGNGTTYGHINADTIIGVAGKVYTLDSDRTVSISSYLQMRGNNCTPIELRSLSNSIKSTIEMPSSAEVVVDFVQMNNMIGTGGADFNAGSASVDVGSSNVGWTFEDAPDFIESGFLGMDRAICENEPVELVAFSYSDNEAYLWSDGSMDSILIVSDAGEYFVEVQFESNCILRDTITIIDSEIFEADLPDNASICTEGSITLDATVSYEDADFLWSNGSMESTLEVSDPGIYYIEIEAFGCTTLDSSLVEFVEDPGDFLPLDTSYCSGEEIGINTFVEGEVYVWQDGSTNATWTGHDEGIKWLDLTLNGCVFRDSMLITTIASPLIELGPDTTICDNESLLVSLSNEYDYLWQDGSSSSEYGISSAGTFVLQAADNGCTSIDSFQVSLRPAPQVDLGDDYVVCSSEEVVLNVLDPSRTFTWDDGSLEPSRRIENSGIYWLEEEEDGCFSRDTVVVDFMALPMIDLGEDVTVCEQYGHVVEPISISNGDLTWQDGSSEELFEVGSPGLITATVFDGLCSNTDSIIVSFKECTFFDIYIPNAFSPNDDGYNDEFEVYLPENLVVNNYDIEIYDRWGTQVFKSLSIDEKWDGSIDTKTLENGVYVYFVSIDYVDDNGPGSEKVTGDIAVFR